MNPYINCLKQAAELLKHPYLQPYVLQVHLRSSPSRNMIPVHQSPTEKRITFSTEPVSGIKGRRNSMGNERIVTFSKPSPDRNSFSSIPGVTDYNTTQKVKELSIDNSQVERVTSKNIASRTSSTMQTPKLIPSKTITTTENWLEPPQASCDRTSHSEVYYIPKYIN
jgi:NIMA (never in mitosis gene a)-related kinase 1/4/5